MIFLGHAAQIQQRTPSPSHSHSLMLLSPVSTLTHRTPMGQPRYGGFAAGTFPGFVVVPEGNNHFLPLLFLLYLACVVTILPFLLLLKGLQKWPVTFLQSSFECVTV